MPVAEREYMARPPADPRRVRRRFSPWRAVAWAVVSVILIVGPPFTTVLAAVWAAVLFVLLAMIVIWLATLWTFPKRSC